MPTAIFSIASVVVVVVVVVMIVVVATESAGGSVVAPPAAGLHSAAMAIAKAPAPRFTQLSLSPGSA